MNNASPRPSFQVLGVLVSAVQIPDVISSMEKWIADQGKSHFVSFTGMHGLSEARRDARFKMILNEADMVVPDGMPVVWLGRWYGCSLRRRVYGPELMETFCRETGPKYRHFFYGGRPGVAESLANSLRQRCQIKVSGTYTPPFRTLTEQEEKDLATRLEEASPDVLWVGLNTPKQERWMYEHRNRLRVPVMLGVGAAFDLNSGRIRRAPPWMREHGLEWLFRLLMEPRRLWKRYLVEIPSAIWSVSIEMLRHKV